jgi:serine protein kinase
VLRARAATPARTRLDQLREAAVVIEKKMFSNTEELLPVISFNAKGRRRSNASMRTS